MEVAENKPRSGRRQTERRLRLGKYKRVSRVGERDEQLRSPELQDDTLERRFAGDYELVDYPAELDVSGSSSSRAVLDRIIAAIEDGELDGIAVANLARLARLAPRERIALVDRIELAGGLILSASEQLDTSTPGGPRDGEG